MTAATMPAYTREYWKHGVWSWFCPVYETSYVLLRCQPADIPELVRREVPDTATQNQILSGFDHNLDGIAGRFIAVSSEKYREVITIWLRPTSGIAVIVHEVIHALTEVLVGRGMRLTVHSDEAFCYYAEWLVRTIFQHLAVPPA